MLARLTGVLEALDSASARIAAPPPSIDLPSPLAYEVLLSPHAAASLAPSLGHTVTLFTIQHLESLSQGASFIPRILAFITSDEKQLFELLTKVKGLGPKRALRIIAAPPSDIANAITSRDARFLSSLPEVGKKLAESIINELADKAAALAASPSATPPSPLPRAPASSLPPHALHAAAALVRLGERAADAELLVRSALSSNPDLESSDQLLAAALATRGA
ncbi:MAG: Holliday junction branch migration protein RuvA [Phycisphaerales bacterium]